MNSSLRQYERIIEKARNHHIAEEFDKENLCYQQIYDVYGNNYKIINNVLEFQISIKNWSSAILSCLILKNLKYNSDNELNLAKLYLNIKKYDEAKRIYLSLNKTKEHYLAYEGLGIISFDQEIYDEALSYFKKAIEINKNSFVSLYYLGNIYKSRGDFDQAKMSYKKAISINPYEINLYSNLISLYISISADYTEIDKLLNSVRELMIIDEIKNIEQNYTISSYKLRHKYEQALYLNEIKKENTYRKSFIEICKDLLINNSEYLISLNGKQINIIKDYLKQQNIYKLDKQLNNYINSSIDWKKIEKQYNQTSPSIVIIDNFLEENTLSELKNFSLESEIWNYEYQNNNYLGSFAGQGNYSEIHHGIVCELLEKMPNLLNNNDFEQMWAFNYDSNRKKGLAAHADFANVNLNFWITPDEFNEGNDMCGLKVYHEAVPDDWTFNDYNVDTKMIKKLITKNDVKATEVPYKYNRAILFDSALFHETQDLNFSDLFEGRRINYTILFGNRVN